MAIVEPADNAAPYTYTGPIREGIRRANELTDDADASTPKRVPVAALGTGTPTGTKFLRDDRTWQVPAGGGSGYATVADEGSPSTQRATLNFTGAGVTVADNAGSSRTDVTIPGGGSSSVETVHTITASGASQTLNPTVTGPYKRITLTANCTFTFAGTTAGQVTRMDVELIENGTGGWTITWPTVKWVGGIPTHITTPNSISVYTFWHNGTEWFGAPVGLGFA